MNTQQWLHKAANRLAAAQVPSARLDAELLLTDNLKKTREWLFAHPEALMCQDPSLVRLEKNIERRIKREPLAYILGRKEFYGRLFEVTPDVLIPRPESEMIIDLLKELTLPPESTFIDIGTGSGALAITAKRELPSLHVVATDISPSAIKVAMKNAASLDAAIVFEISDLLDSPQLPQADCIAANLPYVGVSWKISPETKYEPAEALYGGSDGLIFIKKIITQAPKIINGGGYLILEADPRQQGFIVEFSKNNGFETKQVRDFGMVLQKK